MVLRLEGKSAVITGTGRGIGRAIARKFLQEGARVLVCDIVPERLQTALEEFKQHGEVYAIPCDVTSTDDCRALIQRAKGVLGHLDILVNNAGIVIFEPFLEHTEESWDKTMAVNLKGVFVLGQLAAQVMVAQGKGGAIVNMASSNGHMGEKGLSAYNASKAGVILLTKTMAIELAPHNIRVNCVSPGFIRTELVEEAFADETFIRDYLQKIPLGRHGKPEEVANLFAFLASDEASFITGESVIIDGGQLSEE